MLVYLGFHVQSNSSGHTRWNLGLKSHDKGLGCPESNLRLLVDKASGFGLVYPCQTKRRVHGVGKVFLNFPDRRETPRKKYFICDCKPWRSHRIQCVTTEFIVCSIRYHCAGMTPSWACAALLVYALLAFPRRSYRASTAFWY